VRFRIYLNSLARLLFGVGPLNYKMQEENTTSPVNFRNNGLVLDVGCGNYPQGNINCDIVKPSKKVDNFILATAEALPFKDESFYKINASQLIGHLNNPRLFLEECQRVLMGHGELCIDFPKPFFNNNCVVMLFEFILNFPLSALSPFLLKEYIRKLILLNKNDPRVFHKYIISASFISRYFKIINKEEFAPLLFSMVPVRRLKRLSRWNTALKLTCIKKDVFTHRFNGGKKL